MPGRLPLRLGNRYVRHDADARGDDTRGGDSRHTRTGEPGGKPVGETEEPVRDRDEPADASRPGPELRAQLLAGTEEQHLHGRNGHVELRGDLAVREPAELAQQEHLPLVLGQRRQRSPDLLGLGAPRRLGGRQTLIAERLLARPTERCSEAAAPDVLGDCQEPRAR